MQCSYCKAGLNKRKPLPSPRPRGGISKKTESKIPDQGAQDIKEQTEDDWSIVADAGSEQAHDQVWDFDDVLNCNFSDDFSLVDELKDS